MTTSRLHGWTRLEAAAHFLANRTSRCHGNPNSRHNTTPHITHSSFSTMNGMNGQVPAPGLWQEARNADGRVYYYNTVTKVTQWDKPLELMTPVEVLPTIPVKSIELTTRSAHYPINHGRSIPLKEAVSTGITPKPSKVYGRCQQFSRRLSPLKLQLHQQWRKLHTSIILGYTDHL